MGGRLAQGEGAQSATVLSCAVCSAVYPVIDGIPHLLREQNTARTRLDEISYDDLHASEEDVPEVLLFNWQGIFSDYHMCMGEVLELGCGSGYMTRALANDFPFTAVHAVDISPVFLDLARQKIGVECQDKTTFYVCDANFLPFADNTFDVVIGRSVLHHFVDYEKILARIASMLRPGGYAVFYEPVIQGKAKIAFMLQLMLMVNNRLAEPVFNEEDSQKIRRLQKHLVKELAIGDDRKKLEQMEDKYIFNVVTMQQTGIDCGFSAVHYRNWENLDGSFRIGVEQHLVALGITREKVRKFSFLTRAYRENIIRLLPGEQFTPMGFFIFQK
jgi:ubiquinone/menaquinone biosynthesis C-methylase UbiE/uncharacterized protein YbaR (Trm112 family)